MRYPLADIETLFKQQIQVEVFRQQDAVGEKRQTIGSLERKTCAICYMFQFIEY